VLGLLAANVAPAVAQHPGHDQEEPEPPERKALPPYISPVTDEDRRAAFPDVEGHAVHDSSINHFVLVDQLGNRTRAAPE
jgi:copper resistance protein B